MKSGGVNTNDGNDVCCFATDDLQNVCYYSDNDACGDGCSLVPQKRWMIILKCHKDRRHPARVGCIHKIEHSKNSVNGI